MDVRAPYVAGSFYPGNKEELQIIIKGFIDRATSDERDYRTYIVPHAGYIYSGLTSTYAYKTLEPSIERVVLLGVSHRMHFPYVACDTHTHWETPLGIIPVDETLIEELTAISSICNRNPTPHESEHCLEVQIPFLQMVLKEFKIVPLLLGAGEREILFSLGEILSEIYKKDPFTLIVSSDFYHGYSLQECENQDRKAAETLLLLDPERFFEGLDKKFIACGGAGIVSMLKFAEIEELKQGKIFHQATSADVTGDKTGYTVGYISFGAK